VLSCYRFSLQAIVIALTIIKFDNTMFKLPSKIALLKTNLRLSLTSLAKPTVF
jgi:hypothetical protein